VSNLLRNRARQRPRLTTKEKASALEQALAQAHGDLAGTQEAIDQALNYLYGAIDNLEAALPEEEPEPLEERERVLREKLDQLTAVAVVEAATGAPPEGVAGVAEKLDEVMEAFEALPAIKWPEGPIGAELPGWMHHTIVDAICSLVTTSDCDRLIDAVCAALSQNGFENEAPEAVANTAPAES